MMDRLLSREEAAGLLGVPPKTLATWATQGRGPAFARIGRHARYRSADLERWVEAQMRGAELAPIGRARRARKPASQ